MRRAAACAALVAATLVPAGARADVFSIDPVVVTLPGKGSTQITVTNRSTAPIRFQVVSYAWSESPAGKMTLEPSDHLVYFPKLFTLAPSQQKKIRVGSTAASESVERSYRTFVEELPPVQSVIRPAKGEEIVLRTRVGLAVFVAPLTSSVKGSIAAATMKPHAVAVDVVNDGTRHFMIHHVHLTAKDSSGAVVAKEEIPGWYVLAGATRTFSFPLTAAQCSRITSVSVDATGDVDLSKTFDRVTGTCAAG